jgi:DnaK suppressor protein
MDEQSIADLLAARRRELAGELARLTEPPKAGTNLSFGKRIGDGTTEAVERVNTTATARSIAASLADVDRALAKLADGTYGRCDRCGGEIPPDRLAAIPTAALCVTCSRSRSTR